MLATAAMSALAVGAPARAADTPGTIDGWPAVEALVGNTLVVTRPDQPGGESAVFMLPDGTGRVAERKGGVADPPRAVQWAFRSDGLFCVSDPSGTASDGDCVTLSIAGDTATLAPKDGPAVAGKVLRGDAWQLDPAGAKSPVTGKAAARSLAGNTVVLMPLGGSGEVAAFYFLADGTGRSTRQDNAAETPDAFRWSLRDDGRLCFTDAGKGPADGDCLTVSITGDRVTLAGRDGRAAYGRLLDGDARGLAPATPATRAMIDALAGNTLVFARPDRPGEETTFYLQADGTGRALQGGGEGKPEPVRWSLWNDGRFCVFSARAKAPLEGDCATLSVAGDSVTFTAPGRPAMSGRILKGNARTL
ncbi:hypothetical protein BWR60_06110 [Inquilinus limosus]|uniref:Uncharacterized protein n=1 Tax=Inquilinus limosus TaxID=171674 RepID=A0A211ZS38_9PROT|nr:hypothetical protein BWR60_06110 [Inquilinus limosus]